MRALTVLVLLTISPLVAHAQEDTSVSTGTYCGGIAISTSTAVRVDNYMTGGGRAVIDNRKEILLCVYSDTVATVYCGYDSSVSIDPTDAHGGREIGSGQCVNMELTSKLAYYCKAAAAAPIYAHIEQVALRVQPVYR